MKFSIECNVRNQSLVKCFLDSYNIESYYVAERIDKQHTEVRHYLLRNRLHYDFSVLLTTSQLQLQLNTITSQTNLDPYYGDNATDLSLIKLTFYTKLYNKV